MSKEVDRFTKNVKTLESKPPWRYNKGEMMLALAGMMLFFSIIPKILNLQTWFDNGFNMASYNPYTLFCYVPYTLIYLYIAWEKRLMSFLVLGLIGAIYTLFMVYGFIVTFNWLPIDPII